MHKTVPVIRYSFMRIHCHKSLL